MERTSQKQQILKLHESGQWVCSTELEFMRDHRKRYSELSKAGHIFEARKCDIKGHVHRSPLFMRRLVSPPTVYGFPVKLDPSLKPNDYYFTPQYYKDRVTPQQLKTLF